MVRRQLGGRGTGGRRRHRAAADRDRPRPDEGNRARPAHGALPLRRGADRRRHDRARGRRRRARGDGDADPRRRPLRSCPAAPAARPCRARRGAVRTASLSASAIPRDKGHPQSEEEAAVAARLDALASTTDGFMLAEMDLEQRREGELLGLVPERPAAAARRLAWSSGAPAAVARGAPRGRGDGRCGRKARR